MVGGNLTNGFGSAFLHARKGRLNNKLGLNLSAFFKQITYLASKGHLGSYSMHFILNNLAVNMVWISSLDSEYGFSFLLSSVAVLYGRLTAIQLYFRKFQAAFAS